MADRRRAPIEALERLAEAVDAYANQNHMFGSEHVTPVRETLAAYRAAVAPLRTRAEVDAEIGRIMRDAYSAGPGAVSFSAFTSLHLSRLCSEPTAPDSGPSSADTEENLDENGDPIPTLYTDCGKCRYPTSGKACDDEWCNRRGCCGHDKSKGRL